MIPRFLFVIVITCTHHCENDNIQRDPTPTAFAAALFASEAECNRNIPNYYTLIAQAAQLVYPDGKPAESIASAEKRTYEDHRIICSKVSTENLKGPKG